MKKRSRRHMEERQRDIRAAFALIAAGTAIVTASVLLCAHFEHTQPNKQRAEDARGAAASTFAEERTAALPDELRESVSPRPKAAKKKAEGLLILVNWDNPVPYERPNDLVRLSEVFSGEVKLVNGDGLINAEAGEMARIMFMAAEEDGLTSYILTGAYRSISYQGQLFEARKNADPDYGENPYENPVKVMPGENSEHTTGLALDILAEDYQSSNAAYAASDEGKWLANHAHEFGFIQRYPEGKEHITGVIFEPWHYRYVGKDAAAEIYDAGLCLEEYVEVF